METQVNEYFKNEVNHVKKDDKKKVLAKFIKMQVEKGVDITEYMGKPLSNYDYNKLYLALEEYEGKQLKININDNGELAEKAVKEIKEKDKLKNK